MLHLKKSTNLYFSYNKQTSYIFRHINFVMILLILIQDLNLVCKYLNFRMQLRYSGNLMPFEDSMKKVSAITWASSGKKLAVAAADRCVYLFDQNGQKKDKFPTKPSDKGQKSYLIRALEFSPDAQKIAVAQSDNIVFIYKIGVQWGQKKAICNKFPVSASVTCLNWPRDHQNQIVFGLADGKIRTGILKSNKSNALYSGQTYAVSIASSRDGSTVISGHLDGSVYAYSMQNQSFKKIFTHHSIPYALGYGQNIMAAGNDQKVTFYDTYGNVLQRFDYTHDEKVKDFTVCQFNPSGDTVALGNFNRFYVYNLNQKRGQWEEIICKNIENYYTVTAICWKNDGSRLITGNLCGSVDIYDASVKKVKQGKFQLNYVSPSQVIIQGGGKQSVLKSQNGYEINKINFYHDKYAVGNTYQTLIIVDITTGRSSQIYWKGAGNQKFDFSGNNLCMISNAGQITLVQYGRNQPLGTCRTQYMKSNLISARINQKGTKIIAYLLDLQTICLFDLQTSSILSQINHDSKIDYLELNANANKLLFKDKRKQLYIYNLSTMSKNTLLPYCTFVKWVPESQVVVAQNRQNLNVWYSIDHPQKVTIYTIKGQVQNIERKNGKTEVIVSDNSGNAISSYSLNQALIDFGFALEARDLQKAAMILDSSELNNQTEANWKALAKMALETQNIYVAEHCYGALGDVAKAKFLRKIIRQIQQYQKQTGRTDGITFYKVQARLAILERQFHRAQSIYLENHQVQQAMQMYQQMHKWEQTVKVAQKSGHAQVEQLKSNYYSWLLDSGQQEKAAQIKQQEGDYVTAIQLYLKGGIPARAATVVYNTNVSYPEDLLQKIANSLSSAGMFQKAGQFYQQMQKLQKALDCYIKGNVFKKAVQLAREAEPRLVPSLQQRWGNYLVSIKQTQAAINHYIEAQKIQKAIEASITSRQWNKAIQLLAHQTPQIARPYYRQIAKHYATIRQYDFAQKYFLKAALPIDAFQMYAQANKWEQALRLAKQNLPESQINSLYVKMARKFQEEQKWKEAQKMYLIVEQYDLAIAMYKKCAQYDNMIRLVSKFRSNLLKQTHLAVAQKLHKDGNFKTAQQHYISAGAWRGAVQMYKSQGMWEEAVRCSKLYGKDEYTCQLAKRWAQTLGPEQGMKMLLKMNLVDAVIQYLSDRNQFDQAFKLANQHAKHKIRDVHLKHAFKLEDQKRYKQAESQFVKAGKALEAISMYENIGDFHSALQVASQYQPQARDGILINQARGFIDKRQYIKAQSAFINARKPQLAIKMYLDLGNNQQAIRVARKHAPHLVQQIMRRQASNPIGDSTPQQRLQQAKTWDDTRNYSKAIEGYLSINSEDFRDTQMLQQIWRRAVQLAVTYEKDKAIKVVKIVCGKLCQIRSYDSAGQLLEQINLFQDAVGTYCEGGNYQAAKNCAKMIKNADLNAKLMDYIDRKQRQTNKSQKDPWGALKNGDYETACQIFKQTNDWKNCLDKSRQKGPQLLNKYLNQYIKMTVQSGNFAAAAQAYADYGMQLIPKNYPTYKMLALQIFVQCEQKQIQPLRKSLYDFYRLLQGTNQPGSPTLQQFQKYLMISHLSNLKFTYENRPGAQKLLQKITISLLRYCQFIRLDKLFYEAGMNCQKADQFGLASVFLNRYLDINQIIDDPDNNNISEDDQFKITDIPSPYDVNMPMKNMVSQSQKEKIKDWLLQINMNQKVDCSLPVRNCQKCSTKIYDAAISCYKCQNKSQVCILTGLPVNGSNGKKCKSCGKWGLKEHWSTYLNSFANCPWCNNPPN